ncbi:transcriptional initiation protein Tat [Halegenticoccus soli]|uniref:transcriptional initiation protein Tat n=1 Tax=Halegenticoccus soli TaxID=1985678 RepID=UPI000C6E01A0|nr:transcriptional initiation protein Tat [Halegenticoccus soli]
MVPDIPFTRRNLLVGTGVGLGVGSLGTGLYAPTWLPDPVTDALLSIYPEPPAHAWRPAMSDAHADKAVALLEETVQRATALRRRVDVGSLPEDLAFHLDRSDPSGGWLQSARDESDPWERLFAATYGMQFAGEAVGYAKVALDETDPEALVERGDRLRTAADGVLDSLGNYRISDPARDLAHLWFAERELSLARLDSHRSGTYTGGADDPDEYSERDVAATWGSHVQAEQRLRNARYHRDLYRENLGDGARPHANALDDALVALTDAVNEFPTRDELRRKIDEELELAQETPYGAARWELLTLCYDDSFRFGFEEGGYRRGHTVQRVVEVARALLARRAHAFALSELGVSPDDADYDSGRAFREKRRAVRTFRAVRAEHDSPLAGVLAQEASDRIRAGDVGVGSGRSREDGPAWRDRVEAATYYLVGTGQMRELGGVLGAILGGSQ